MRGRILIVDDDRGMCDVLEGDLGWLGFAAVARTSAEEALIALGREELDVVLSDIRMPGTSGIALCRQVVASRPDIPVIVMTAFGTLEAAVEAIRAGAYDFATKPFEVQALALMLDRAVQHRALREEVKRLRRVVADSKRLDDMVGSAPAMQQLFDLIERAADSDASVLVTGETGTGKELVARALHRRSRRRGGPFVAVNCAALPETLLESELFGHARGAFTDAKTARDGLFVKASGGTLFLDEIGDMPLGLQPKLLRALQERKVRPVGSDTEVPFDARLVAATHSDLEAAVDEGRFREDLFFRVNVIHIDVPPLRARGGDDLVLAQRFLEHFAGRAEKRVTTIAGPAAEKLIAYNWPGNVRELQNSIERAVALTRFEQIMVEDLPEKVRSHRSSHVVVASDDPSEILPMQEVERRYILRVLEAAGGNKTLAARLLGFDRMTLYRKLERYGMGGKDSSPP